MKAIPLRLVFLFLCGLLLTGCGSSVSDPEPVASNTPTSHPTLSPTDTPDLPPAERVQIHWYVGLGVGSLPEDLPAQEKIVADFNASQDEIELLLEVVPNTDAYTVLEQRIAEGNAPDLVGPMGIAGRDTFPHQWLDLDPLIQKNRYDLRDFGPAMVKFYNLEEQGQIGIPFAIFPSLILVNTDLFEAAGIPTPPQEYGEPYIDEKGVEHEWNMDTLRLVAMKLTVDEQGHNALDPQFNPETVEQFGFGNQWTDMRGVATIFGPGRLIDSDGHAYMPPHWQEAMHWYYNGMWQDYFYPNNLPTSTELFPDGNWFISGKMAMVNIHLWYVGCCMGSFEGNWDTAVVPSYNGITTAKMHADTFGILKSTQHPDKTFQVLTYLLGEKAYELSKIYGGMPARLSLQTLYFDELVNQFAGQDINWEVIVASMAYPDTPHHEEGLPHTLAAKERYTEFWTLLATEPDLDIDGEIELLLKDLQTIYDEAR